MFLIYILLPLFQSGYIIKIIFKKTLKIRLKLKNLLFLVLLFYIFIFFITLSLC